MNSKIRIFSGILLVLSLVLVPGEVVAETVQPEFHQDEPKLNGFSGIMKYHDPGHREEEEGKWFEAIWWATHQTSYEMGKFIYPAGRSYVYPPYSSEQFPYWRPGNIQLEDEHNSTYWFEGSTILSIARHQFRSDVVGMGLTLKSRNRGSGFVHVSGVRYFEDVMVRDKWIMWYSHAHTGVNLSVWPRLVWEVGVGAFRLRDGRDAQVTSDVSFNHEVTIFPIKPIVIVGEYVYSPLKGQYVNKYRGTIHWNSGVFDLHLGYQGLRNMRSREFKGWIFGIGFW